MKRYCILIPCCFLLFTVLSAQSHSSKKVKIYYRVPNQEQRNKAEQLQQCCKTDKEIICSEKTKGTVYKIISPPFDTCKTVFLTLDACISGFDVNLIQFLINNQIKATLFVTAQWIANEPQAVALLQKHLSLFDIQNHGTLHRPASVCGCKVYGIEGTHNYQELVAEVMMADSAICKVFGKKSVFFRPGTAFSDQQAICGIEKMGYKVMGYSVAADAGASFPKEIIKQKILHARHGDILLLHFNAKGNNVYNGFIEAYKEIVEKEYCIYFDKIINYPSYFMTY